MVYRHPFSSRPAGDTGDADPRVADALAAWARGAGSEHGALTALAAARLLVPVVAVLTEQDDSGAGKESEMALPTLIGNDGRPAIIAFTGVGRLSRWRPDARPVAAPASRVWQAAVAETCAVVIDVAGPVPFVVEGARLAALAAGDPPPLPHLDADIRAAVKAAVQGEPSITGFTLFPGTPASRAPACPAPAASAPSAPQAPAGTGTDLAITLHGADTPAAARAAHAIAASLTPRLRRGIEVTAAG